jgi:hypothetical protein
MRDRLNPPEYPELPDDRLRNLRAVVMTEVSRNRRARLRGLRTVPVAVTILVLATAAAAGATWLRSEWNPATEILPEDRAEAIARLGADIPLPPGGNFDALIEADYTEDEEGMAGTLAFHAWCQWTGNWLDGVMLDEPLWMDDALVVMTEVPSWRQISSPDSTGDVARGLAAIAAAAAEGDIEPVVQHYGVNCTGVDVERDARLLAHWPWIPQGPIAPDNGS